MKKEICLLRMVFVFMLLVPACWAALSEAGILPTNYLEPDGNLLYRMELLSVVSAMGGIYFGLRLFAFKRVKHHIEQPDKEKSRRSIRRWTLLRTGLMACAVWVNTVLYYSTDYMTTPKYCLLMSLAACVFCWPGENKDEESFTEN